VNWHRVLHVVPYIGSLALVHSNAILRVKYRVLPYMQVRALRLAFSHHIKRCQVRQHCSQCLVQVVVPRALCRQSRMALIRLLELSTACCVGVAPGIPDALTFHLHTTSDLHTSHEPITEGLFSTISCDELVRPINSPCMHAKRQESGRERGRERSSNCRIELPVVHSELPVVHSELPVVRR
jgi:hypothetical protein